MAQVTAQARRTIEAPAEKVLAALADYESTRPGLLTENYQDYRVESGGHGAGSRVAWKLEARKGRLRDQLVEVSAPGPLQLVERDTHSSMVTTWTVASEGTNRSTVTVDTVWNGAGGVGGFFEKLFAPKGMARIHDGVLARLDAAVAG